ncbi:MAG: hypothetical protein WCH74_12055 [Chloroflexota bacterium]
MRVGHSPSHSKTARTGMATQSRTETGAVPIVSSGLSVPDNSVQHRLGDQDDQHERLAASGSAWRTMRS